MKVIQPKVELINYTQDAENLLLFTKYSRLSRDVSDAMEVIKSWSDKRKQEELRYIFSTIESSWEFVTYTFCVTGCTREYTHQIVRTRSETKGEFSIQQESQRTVSMEGGFNYGVSQSLLNNRDRLEVYVKGMEDIQNAYDKLISMGAAPQEARGLLPTKVETKIILKFDLRTLSHIMLERLCTRAQGEAQRITLLMRDEVLKVHPWTDPILRVYCAKVGTCRFPNYHMCPIKGMQFNPETGGRYHNDNTYAVPPHKEIDTRDDSTRPATKNEIQKAWEIMNEQGGFEAVPEMQKK